MLSDSLIQFIKQKHPDFQIIDRTESKLMKLLSVLLFFNRGFLNSYTTTIGKKIYFSSSVYDSILNGTNNLTTCTLIAHEYIHISDQKRYPIIFQFVYLFPQILAIFSILAIWNLWFLLFLLCLAPIPSLGRAYLEYRAFKMSIYFVHFVGGIEEDLIDIEKYVDKFCRTDYYFMFPFRSYVRRKFRDILNNDASSIYREVIQSVAHK